MKYKTVRIRSQKSGSKQSQNYGVCKWRTEDIKPPRSGQIPTLKHSTREPRLKRCSEFLVQLICVNLQHLSQNEKINLNVSVWWFLLNTILLLLPTVTIVSSVYPPKIPSTWERKGKHSLEKSNAEVQHCRISSGNWFSVCVNKTTHSIIYKGNICRISRRQHPLTKKATWKSSALQIISCIFITWLKY